MKTLLMAVHGDDYRFESTLALNIVVLLGSLIKQNGVDAQY